MRATFRLSSPAWLAQPRMTSSMRDGSIPERSTTARSTAAARSSGRTRASAPPYRPIGVRTAAMIHGSRSDRERSRVIAKRGPPYGSADSAGPARSSLGASIAKIVSPLT